MKKLPLKTGGFTLVDIEDYYRFKCIKWTTSRAKNTTYVRPANGRGAALHRQIMDAKPGQIVDHVNGNGLDNRRMNLRLCTHAENIRNSAKRKGSSKYKGVYLKYRGRKHTLWQARIYRDGALISLGLYRSEIEAARAYDMVAVEIHGEFARLNFPEEHE